jgi:hypothetical protein
MWKTELDKLLAWLVQIDTDPEITEAIKLNLQHTIFQSGILTVEKTNQTETCIEVQSNIGWAHFMEGFITPEWHYAQQIYYSSIKLLCTGKRWHKLITSHMRVILWKLWEHRNRVMHDKTNSSPDEEKIQQLNQKIDTLYSSLLEKLPDQDQYLLALPLHDLTRKGIGYKKE